MGTGGWAGVAGGGGLLSCTLGRKRVVYSQRNSCASWVCVCVPPGRVKRGRGNHGIQWDRWPRCPACMCAVCERVSDIRCRRKIGNIKMIEIHWSFTRSQLKLCYCAVISGSKGWTLWLEKNCPPISHHYLLKVHERDSMLCDEKGGNWILKHWVWW